MQAIPFLGLYEPISSLSHFLAAALYRLRQRFSLKKLSILAIGGVAYALGGVIDAIEAPVLIQGVFGPHEIFHLLVVIGASCHYVFIYGWAEHRMRKVRTIARAIRQRLRTGGALAWQ